MGRYTKNLHTRWDSVKGALDDYCTFSWNGRESIEDDLRTFIVNDKKTGLLSHNGLNFTNTYSKPQFTAGSGTLQGVTFNTKQIKFKIGTYGLTLDSYAKVMDWLNPYVIGVLVFDYDQKYAYHCKLAQFSDSEKYIISYNSAGEPLYYFETNVTFDIIGDIVKHGLNPYPWIKNVDLTTPTTTTYYIDPSKTIEQSQLDIGFVADLSFSYNFSTSSSSVYLEAIIKYDNVKEVEGGNPITTTLSNRLFKITFNEELKNIKKAITINLSYDSNTGVILFGDGGTNFSLLTLLSLYNGQKLLTSLESSKLILPGFFSKEMNYNNLQIEFNLSIDEAKIHMFPKKKLI